MKRVSLFVALGIFVLAAGIRAFAQVCASHGMLHFGEIELARTLVGAESVAGV